MLTCNIKTLSKSEVRCGFTTLRKSTHGKHSSSNTYSFCVKFYLGELGMSLPFTIVSETLSSSKKRKSQPAEERKETVTKTGHECLHDNKLSPIWK